MLLKAVDSAYLQVHLKMADLSVVSMQRDNEGRGGIGRIGGLL